MQPPAHDAFRDPQDRDRLWEFHALPRAEQAAQFQDALRRYLGDELNDRLISALPESLYAWNDLAYVIYPEAIAAIDTALKHSPDAFSPKREVLERHRHIIGFLRSVCEFNSHTERAEVRHAKARVERNMQDLGYDSGYSERQIVEVWEHRWQPIHVVSGRPAAPEEQTLMQQTYPVSHHMTRPLPLRTTMPDAPLVLDQRQHTFFGGIVELLFAIKYARANIYVASFIVTHQTVKDKLIEASKRGVDVRLYTDQDQLGIGGLSNSNLIRELQAADIPVFTQRVTMPMHSKYWTVDDAVYMIGSSNVTGGGYPHAAFGVWSMPSNFETNIVICENPIAYRARQDFLHFTDHQFARHADEVTFNRHCRRSTIYST